LKRRGANLALARLSCRTTSTTSIAIGGTDIACIAVVSVGIATSRPGRHTTYTTYHISRIATKITLVVAELTSVTIVATSTTNTSARNAVTRATLDFATATALANAQVKPSSSEKSKMCFASSRDAVQRPDVRTIESRINGNRDRS